MFRTFDQMIDEGVREGIRLAFENNAYEHCDGSDDPEDRCESEGACVCVYVQWKKVPWWRRMLTKQPPRPSEATCQRMVIDRMVNQALDDIRADKYRKRAALASQKEGGHGG